MKADKTFVELCNQHAAFIAGRGVISESIESLLQLQRSYACCVCIHHSLSGLTQNAGVEGADTKNDDTLANSNAAYSLLLPGKILNLRALSIQKKFGGGRGNKEGAKRSSSTISCDTGTTVKGFDFLPERITSIQCSGT